MAVCYKRFEAHCAAAVRSAAAKIPQKHCYCSPASYSPKLSGAAGLAVLEALQQSNTTAVAEGQAIGVHQCWVCRGASLTLLLQVGRATQVQGWAGLGLAGDQLGAGRCAAAKGAACTHRRVGKVVIAGLQGRSPEVRFENEIRGE